MGMGIQGNDSPVRQVTSLRSASSYKQYRGILVELRDRNGQRVANHNPLPQPTRCKAYFTVLGFASAGATPRRVFFSTVTLVVWLSTLTTLS